MTRSAGGAGRITGRTIVGGAALAYLGALIFLPLVVLGFDGLRDGPRAFLAAIEGPAARHALILTLWTSALTAAVNAVMGTLTAFVLVRYRFTGRTLLATIVDLPLAIPTLVTGVMLVVLYGPQSAIGGVLERDLGVPVIFAPPGILLALLFVTFPFVVRVVEPAVLALDIAQEEAAATLGARGPTTFLRVTLPAIRPALIAGTLLCFARAVGEFGAIVIVAGNRPLATQTAAVYVYGEIESENARGASAMSLILLAIAFTLTAVVEWLHRARSASPRPVEEEEAA
jgi:sulfate transport system permease protein